MILFIVLTICLLSLLLIFEISTTCRLVSYLLADNLLVCRLRAQYIISNNNINSGSLRWCVCRYFLQNNVIIIKQLLDSRGFCDILNNQGLGQCYQPQPSASADNTYLDLDYSGYQKNIIQEIRQKAHCFIPVI